MFSVYNLYISRGNEKGTCRECSVRTLFMRAIAYKRTTNLLISLAHTSTGSRQEGCAGRF